MTPAAIREYIEKYGVNVWHDRVRRPMPVLEGLFTEIVRGFMSDEQNLYEGNVRYDPTGTCTGSLYVEPSGNWDHDSTDRRPAVIVDIGDLSYTTLKGMSGGYYDMDLEEGEYIHHRDVRGSLTIACLSPVKGECMNYSANIADLMDAFSTAIKHDFCFDLFELKAIVRPRLRKETPRDWESLVQFEFKFQETFATKRESQKLKQVVLTLSGTPAQQIQLIK